MRFGANEAEDILRPPAVKGRTPGDWKYRTPAQQAALKIKRQEMRAAMESDAARAWSDLVAADLGDPPPRDNADAWWDRAEQALALAVQYGYGGPIGRLAENYAEQCRRTAAVIDPARFGPKAQIPTGPTGASLALVEIRFVGASDGLPARDVTAQVSTGALTKDRR